MLDDVTEGVVGRIFKIKVEGDPERISQMLARRIISRGETGEGEDKREVKNEEAPKKKDKSKKEKKLSNKVNTDKIGRNDPCPCGSGKKYKKCCLDKS